MDRQTTYLAVSNFLLVSLTGAIPLMEARAQSVVPNPGASISASMERRTAEQNLRSLPMKIREKRNRNSSDPRHLEQMNEDFVRVQIIRREMVREIAAGRSFDLRRLEDDSGEIKKRAARLKAALALLDNEIEKRPSAGAKQFTRSSIDGAVYDLCVEISRFTENPIFKANGVYTVRDATSAVRSLDLVIELAEAISESAERLRKSN